MAVLHILIGLTFVTPSPNFGCLHIRPESTVTWGITSFKEAVPPSGLCLQTIVHIGFPNFTKVSPNGHPCGVPPCSNSTYRTFGQFPSWTDCYNIPLVIHRIERTSEMVWDWSHHLPTSSRQLDWVTPGGWVPNILTSSSGTVHWALRQLATAVGSVSVSNLV